MGYRDDGFFNINWGQDARNSGESNGGRQNPPFLFPDKSIRFLDAQAELQRKFNQGKDTLSKGDYAIHRGYIRNLEQPQYGAVPISKCNFQFNPQEIRQNVAMREDIYLPLLQTPEQLAQPIGAVVNFTFDLLFDRSQELSKGYSGSRPTGSTADAMDRDVVPTNSNPDIVDPYDVGVLSDLKVLYSVIGQGFSLEMLNFQKKTFVANAELINSRINNTQPSDTADSTEGTETDSATGTSTGSSLGEIDDDNLTRMLEANYGNWGLLMPNPVRVMFSSLFMLDGFITGTNVDFLKFNTKMVPLMCRVTMNMSAMYIGFARKDTFLTTTFEAAAKDAANRRAEDERAKQEILKALKTTGSQFALVSTWAESTDISAWDRVANNNANPMPTWALVVNDEAGGKATPNGPVFRGLVLGFPKVQIVEGGGTRDNPDGTTTPIGRDKDDILLLFDGTTSFSVGYDWSINIYGGITQGTKLTSSDAQVYLRTNTYTSNPSIKKVGSYSGSETATSDAEWGKGGSGDGVKAERVRRRTIRGNQKLSNLAETNFSIHDYSSPAAIDSWVKDAYYIVEVSVTLRATYGTEGGEISTTLNSKRVIGGQSNISERFVVNWETDTQNYTNGVSDTPPVISTPRGEYHDSLRVG